MKVPVLAIASTALIAGLAYRALKGSAEPGQAGSTKRNPSPIKQTGRQASKAVADAAEELSKEGAARLRREFSKFKKSSGIKMRNYDKTLSMVKSKLAEAGDEVKDKYSDVVSDIEKRSREMKKRMSSFKQEGKDQWVGFKKEFTKDMEELGKDLKSITLS